jgi:4-hydroxy-3-polyprenylbenzoate decarboxylase
MVVIPCSMGTIGRMAAGLSSDLLTRAADVMLQERRRLSVVPRELPLYILHLRNLATLSACGAIVCPASPSFYNHPQTIEALGQTVTHRVIALLGRDSPSPEWGK